MEKYITSEELFKKADVAMAELLARLEKKAYQWCVDVFGENMTSFLFKDSILSVDGSYNLGRLYVTDDDVFAYFLQEYVLSVFDDDNNLSVEDIKNKRLFNCAGEHDKNSSNNLLSSHVVSKQCRDAAKEYHDDIIKANCLIGRLERLTMEIVYWDDYYHDLYKDIHALIIMDIIEDIEKAFLENLDDEDNNHYDDLIDRINDIFADIKDKNEQEPKKHPYRKFLSKLGIHGDDVCVFNTQEIVEDESEKQKYQKQKEIFGFDTRETWSLDYTLTTWLYSHLKAYVEFSKDIIDLEYHKIKIPLLMVKNKTQDDNQEDNQITMKINTKSLISVTEKQAIDIICNNLEPYLKDPDTNNPNPFIQRKYAYLVLAEILNFLWW